MIWVLTLLVVVLGIWCFYNSLMIEGLIKRVETVETRRPSMRDALRERFRGAIESQRADPSGKSGRETLREHLVARGRL